MPTLPYCLATILWGIALIHLAWGFGLTWPMADAAALARAVVGAKGIVQMPSLLACIIVFFALMVAGALALSLGGGALGGVLALPRWLSVAGGVGLSLVFLLRGAAAYTPFWRNMVPEQPFATLDVTVYAPLCLGLGAGFVVLVINALRS